MRDDVRHIVRESLDFTPNGNRAERVQIVNGYLLSSFRGASQASEPGMTY